MIDILNENVVTQIISEINNGEENETRRKAFNAYSVYKGNLRPYVISELKQHRPNSWNSYSLSNISISKMVVNKLAKAYKEKPEREVEGDDAKTQFLNDLYKESGLQRSLMAFDQYYNLHRECLFWVNYDKFADKMIYMPLNRSEYSVIRNRDNGELMCVVLKYPDTTITSEANLGDGRSDLINEGQGDSAADSEVYALWTNEHHVVVRLTQADKNINVTYVSFDDNPENINPLGVLPFVYLSQDLSTDNPVPNPITEQTVTFNVLWSELLTAANIQGTAIFTLEYDEKFQGQFDNLTHGLTTALELPQPHAGEGAPTKASFINPSPDLSGQKEVYLTYLRQVLAENGITSSQGLDGSMENFNSALERMVAQADVQSIIETNQVQYQVLEQKILELTARWLELRNIKALSVDDSLVVKFRKPRVLVSDGETLANIEKMLNLGLIEKWEALTKLDPNMTESEAKEKLERINGERVTTARALIGRNEQISETN